LSVLNGRQPIFAFAGWCSVYNVSAGIAVSMNSNLFAPVIGQKAQGCWLGYGSVLFLEFGQPQPVSDGPNNTRGQWGLQCDWVQWRIEQQDRILAGSEDDRATIESGIGQVDGKTFISGEILQPSGDSVLTFSDDLVVRTFVITTEKDPRWNFRDQEGKYFLLGPDRAYPEE
jgi:hypothetical protein